MSEQLIQQIVKHVGSVNDAKVLQEAAVGKTDQQNELLMFIKPEVFLVDDEAKKTAAVKLVFEKIAKFNATVAGVVIVQMFYRLLGFDESIVVDDGVREGVAIDYCGG